MRETKGITLIALVITIIVLLILAGVAITMLSGENGILRQAAKAKTQYEVAGLKEEVTIKIAEKQLEESLNKEIEEYLKEIDNAEVTKVAEDTWHVKRGTSTVTVYDDGEIVGDKIELWDGESSQAPEIKEFNWYIYNAKQLKFFADYVNSKDATTGEYVLTNEQKDLIKEKGYEESDLTIGEDTIVYLMSNIDLGARETNGNWETEENNSLKWTPIGGLNKNFIGIFEGNNHYIRGAYVSVDGGYAGIFGVAYTIQNLSIKNSYIKSTGNGTGGVVGIGTVGNIINCHNINTQVTGGTYSAGGIVGQFQGTKMEGCSNSGNIDCEGTYSSGLSGVGGIAGLSTRRHRKL